MARPVQIDRRRAFQAAKTVYWQRGYAATSMSHLLKATGMGAGSFYAAFESKSALFKQVVDDYNSHFFHLFSRIGEQHQGLDIIAVFLKKTLLDPQSETRQRGCLLVNTSLELKGVEPNLHRYVLDGLKLLRAEVLRCLHQAQDLGQLRNDLDASDATDLLLSLIQGLRVESRHGMKRRDARQRVKHMLRIFSSPGYIPSDSLAKQSSERQTGPSQKQNGEQS